MEEMIDGREDEKSVTWAVNDLGSVDYDYHPEAKQLFWITLVAGLLSVMPAAGAMMIFNALVIRSIIGDVWSEYSYGEPAYNAVMDKLDRIYDVLLCLEIVCMLAFVVLAAVQLRAHKPQGLLTCRLLLWFLVCGWAVALLFALLMAWSACLFGHVNVSFFSEMSILVGIIALFLYYLVKGLRLSYCSQDMEELYPSWYRGRKDRSWLIASICIFAPALLGAFLALGI